MRTTRFALLAASALAVAFLAGSPRAGADDKMPGEATDLTPEVRAKAQAQIDILVAGKDADGVLKARRALLLLGPVVWPVVENASHLAPPEASKPHFNLLKTLLSKKTEAEFEWLRARLRRRFLMDDMEHVHEELVDFRLGRKDPADAHKRIPPACKPSTVGTAFVYRSSDGTIVVAYGADGTDAKPDAAQTEITEPAAGFLGVVGGKPKPAPHHSGGGNQVTATAPMGFAYAYASDGAIGLRPGGEGGEAGAATVKGGAGEFAHSGNGGAGAPG